MSYFSEFKTVTEIKSAYRKLAMENHPDRGGDTEVMKTINAEYKEALKSVHGQTSEGSDGKAHTYYYNDDVESALMEKINELLSLNMTGVEIALVGLWIWIDGNTKPYKESFKKLKLRWHSKRKMWYFATTKKKTQYKKNFSFDDMKASYGYRTFDKTDDTVAIA